MVAGLVAFGLYLYFFVGVNELIYSLQKITTFGYLFFFSLAIGSMLLALLFWTYAWRSVLRTLSIDLGLKKAFMIFLVGYFLDLLIPSETIGSEVTRLYLVHNETNADLGGIAASAITNRVVEYSIVAVGLFGSVIALISAGNVPSLVSGFLSAILIGVVIYLAILLFLVLNERAAQVIVSWGIRLLRFLRVKRYNAPDIEEKSKASLTIFYRGFQTFRQTPRKLVKPFTFQILSFLFNLAVYVLVFEALGIVYPSFEFFVIVFFISSAIQGASASLSVGSLDIVLVTVFMLYGIPAADSGIAVIILRSATYWFPLLLSYVMVQAYGVRNILTARSRENVNPMANPEEDKLSKFPTNCPSNRYPQDDLSRLRCEF
jgi:uncharacterized protein (TIRG00374 family)